MRIENRMLNKVEAYVKHKNSTGIKFDGFAYTLRSFAKYADRHYPGKPLTISLALQWVAKSPHLAPATRLAYYSALRGFAKYLKLNDAKTELIPKNIYTAWFKRVTPYIYSEQEISIIMTTSSSECTNKFNTLTQKTVVGLLYSTGMRIGEVLALRKNDVDLKNGIITVRQFKKMPMRLIPVSESVLAKLVEYDRKRRELRASSKDGSFFLTTKGRTVSYASFHGMWKRILAKTGIGEGKTIPRIHDLRHTFACNHLLRAYKENRDINEAVYTLSVYLGHTVIAGTYWYLSATPELLEQCVKRVEKSLLKRKKSES